MTEANQPTPTAIKRFLRDTARSLQNDLATASECLDDFLQIDPHTAPQEAGETLQIVSRKNEACATKAKQLIAFMAALRKAETEQSVKARAELSEAFDQFSNALEGGIDKALLGQ